MTLRRKSETSDAVVGVDTGSGSTVALPVKAGSGEESQTVACIVAGACRAWSQGTAGSIDNLDPRTSSAASYQSEIAQNCHCSVKDLWGDFLGPYWGKGHARTLALWEGHVHDKRV